MRIGRQWMGIFVSACLWAAGAGGAEKPLPAPELGAPREEGAPAGAEAAPPRNAALWQAEKMPVRRGREESRTAPATPTTAGSGLGLLIGYTLLLGGILAGGLWLVGKHLPTRRLFASPAMEVLGRTHLDPRNYLALARVGRRVLVVGVGPDGMRPLGEIAESAEVAELLAVARPRSEAGVNLFQRLLGTRLRENEAEDLRTAAVSAGEELRDELGQLRERVKNLREQE